MLTVLLPAVDYTAWFKFGTLCFEFGATDADAAATAAELKLRRPLGAVVDMPLEANVGGAGTVVAAPSTATTLSFAIGSVFERLELSDEDDDTATMGGGVFGGGGCGGFTRVGTGKGIAGKATTRLATGSNVGAGVVGGGGGFTQRRNALALPFVPFTFVLQATGGSGIVGTFTN